MKQLVIILYAAIVTPILNAQHFEVKLSEKHAQTVDKAKTGKQKLKLYKKFYKKDSAKIARAEKRYWEQKLDSAIEHAAKEQKALEKLEQWEGKGRLPEGTLENYQHFREMGVTAQSMLKTPKDSIKNTLLPRAKALGQEKLQEREEYARLREMKDGNPYLEELNGYRSMLGGDSLSLDSLKATVLSNIEARAKEELLRSQPVGELQEQQQALEELQKMPEQKLSQYQSQIGGYKEELNQSQDRAYLKEKARETAKAKAAQFFTENADKLASVQKKVSKLMNKYSSVLNSNDLSTAVKRTSLKGKPLKERLVLGGNFQVNTLEPVSVDLSPLLGYKLNKKFVLGVGGTYRQTFGSVDDIKNLSTEVYGGKGFVRYDVVKSFFAYGECEYMNTQAMDSTRDVRSRQWVSTLQLGVGRKFSIHPLVQGQVMVLYNFLHDPDRPVYPRPWSIRVGFSLSELAMLKR